VYPNSTDKLSGQILRSKISIQLLIHMGSKTLSLRDNQQKPKNWILWGYLCIEQGGEILTIFLNCTMPAKKFWPSLSVNSKKRIVIRTLLSS
jgi:hypothetical protein